MEQKILKLLETDRRTVHGDGTIAMGGGWVGVYREQQQIKCKKFQPRMTPLYEKLANLLLRIIL
jgi:hypothetical protein